MTEHHCVFTQLTLDGASNCGCRGRSISCVDCWEQDGKHVKVPWCVVDKEGRIRALCDEHTKTRRMEFVFEWCQEDGQYHRVEQ